MIRAESHRPALFSDGLNRREFLQAGSLSLLGLSLAGGPAVASRAGPDRNCILLFLVGGPSQLDTWDMKPSAPAEIRGPFAPIATNVPGVQISEIFPRTARVMDKVALLRGCNHSAIAVHDAGHQIMQTGRLSSDGLEHPHMGCVLSSLKGPRGDAPPHVLLPRPIGNTGGGMSHGQGAGYLGKRHEPFVPNGDRGLKDLCRADHIAASREDHCLPSRAADHDPDSL